MWHWLVRRMGLRPHDRCDNTYDSEAEIHYERQKVTAERTIRRSDAATRVLNAQVRQYEHDPAHALMHARNGGR
jgi:hypothetical protein